MNNTNNQKTLIILNDPPYGTERSWNGLRLAISLASREGDEVRLFLLGDAVSCAKRGQQTPNGYYNLERMLKAAAGRGAAIGACGTCLDARGLKDDELVEGVRRSSLDELTSWTQWADKVLVF
ncbi:MAG: DsrE family protein [Chloroflexota bacterium]|nr:DsrE family protein [Chloroflexota bacterium]